MHPKIIVISGHIGFEITAENVRKQLNEAKPDPVEIQFNSPGGFVYVGIEIFNLIREYPGHTTAKIMSLAASMGSYVPLAADKVIAHDNTVGMIHNAGSVVIGNHNDMREAADYMESLSDLMANAYVVKTGKTIAEIKQLMDKGTFFFGNELLDAGFVDEIIEAPEKDKKKDKASAVTESKLMVEAVFARMKESVEAQADLLHAAAYLKEHHIMHIDVSDDEVNEADLFWLPLDAHGVMNYDQLSEIYNKGETLEPEAPFPNEHACRIRNPEDFKKDSFRRIKSSGEGKKFDIIIGKLKGKTNTTTQAFRYPKDNWTESEAKKHCKDHDGILFEPATGSGNDINNCPNCSKTSKEENRMNLEKLLNENPEARADFNKAIADAKKAGADAVQVTIKKVVPVMLSEDYPQAVKALGGKVLEGTEEVASFTAVVTMEDARIEKDKAEKAEKEEGKETPPGSGGAGTVSENGEIKTPEDFAAAEAKHKSDK